MRPEIQQAITRAAREAGVDPAYALAVAERESAGDPNARSSKSIAGLFQMTGGLRRQYGAGDSADPYTQAKAWTAFIKDTKGEMARVLGRPVTDQEAYLGHHFGAVRAARGLRDDPSTSVDQYFSPYERSINPHFDKAGTMGRLNSSVMADIGKRQARYGGAELPDLSAYGTPVGKDSGKPQAIDLSSFGSPVAANLSNLSAPQQAPAYAPAAAPVPAVAAINAAAPSQPSSNEMRPVSFGMRGVGANPPAPDLEPLRASSPADLESA